MMPIASRLLRTTLGDMRIELFAPARIDADVACTWRIIGPLTRKEGRTVGVAPPAASAPPRVSLRPAPG